MEALVLEKKGKLNIRDIDVEKDLGRRDVRIAVHTVGICGSDLHYYEKGRIGPFVVNEPMILGHEAAGTILQVGEDVRNLRPGDRVCMEPGITDPASEASRRGMYNLDPGVTFWATPPVHGCLVREVVHPASLSFRLPDNVTFGEAAMTEPLAVGLHAATKAGIHPGEKAVVIGSGTIGIVTALAALAGGCSHVIITDVMREKLELAARLGPITPVFPDKLGSAVSQLTMNWGVDIVFEASGDRNALSGVFNYLCPGGRIVCIGCPPGPVEIDVVSAQLKEARILTIFQLGGDWG